MTSLLTPNITFSDNTRGIYQGQHIQEVAAAYGWTGQPADINAEDYAEATQEAEKYLDGLAPEGYNATYNDSGDFGVYADEDTEYALKHFTAVVKYQPNTVKFYKQINHNPDPERHALHPDGNDFIYYADLERYTDRVTAFVPANIDTATHATLENGIAHGDYQGSTVELSNYQVALEEYPAAQRIVYGYGGHDLMLPLAAAAQIHEQIESYPALDDEKLSRLENDLQQEAITDTHGPELVSAVLDLLGDSPAAETLEAAPDNGEKLFNTAHAANGYAPEFIHESISGPYFATQELVDAHTAQEWINLIEQAYGEKTDK